MTTTLAVACLPTRGLLSGVFERRRPAQVRPAFHPGARPPCGGVIAAVWCPLTASSHETREFEFHISPVPSSSSPPGRSREIWDRRKKPRRAVMVGVEVYGAFHGVGAVIDDAVTPTPHLVAEELRSTQRRETDWSFADGATVGCRAAPHRGHLDDVARATHSNAQCRVVERLSWPSPAACCEKLIDAAAEPHDGATRSGPERQPEQFDGYRIKTLRGRPRQHGLLIL